ncbi:MAG: hypothetical protein ACREBV_02300 [Candidatus Zixiibacteriota bacterium]
MQFPIKYDFRDVLAAPAAAFSAKRIFVMTLFLCGSLIVYDVFTCLALFADGENVRSAYSVYGFLPFDSFDFSETIGLIIYWAGIVFSLMVLMLGMFAVAAFEFESLRGFRFMGIKCAIGFALGRFKQMFLSHLSIVSFLLLILLLFVLYGLIGRIPVVGEWIFSIFFVIPGFILAIFTVFIVLVLIISVILLPAVSAADRNGETFDSILETFSTIIRQPVRWLFYTAYSGVAAKVCGFVYAYFCYRAIQFLTWSASLGGGEEITQLVKSGANNLPIRSEVVSYTFNIFSGIDWGVNIAAWARGSYSDEPVAYLMSFMLFLIFASIFGYMLAIISTAQARSFVIVRFLKDTYKIPDEKPMFFEEEHVNPKIDEPASKSD